MCRTVEPEINLTQEGRGADVGPVWTGGMLPADEGAPEFLRRGDQTAFRAGSFGPGRVISASRIVRSLARSSSSKWGKTCNQWVFSAGSSKLLVRIISARSSGLRACLSVFSCWPPTRRRPCPKRSRWIWLPRSPQIFRRRHWLLICSLPPGRHRYRLRGR